MLGKIGAKLQTKCTDNYWILQHKCLDSENCMDGSLPNRVLAGRFSLPID